MGGRTSFTLGRLAEALGATLDRDPGKTVSGVAPLETATADDISFVTDPRYRAAALASRAGAFVVGEPIPDLPAPALRCPAPRHALIDLLGLFFPPPPVVPGVHASAVIAKDAAVDVTASVGALAVIESDAVVGARVRVHPLVYVGAGTRVGDDSVLYPHVVLREGVRLGRRVIVHAGTVIGADGFGYAFDGTAHRKVPQVGGVIIEDDVEIGANSAIDRATLGDTIVRRGTKIDNLVQIGHNVDVGEAAILAGQVGIAGSSRVGAGAVLAGQVGVADHVTIGDRVVVGAQAGVARDVDAGGKVIGSPARPMTQFKRIWIAEGHLPELVRRLHAMERRLAELEAQLGAPRGGNGDG
jgi:UDP-3-O-[3-hydroxymyristoyl] glucosamine N-acyltransferase